MISKEAIAILGLGLGGAALMTLGECQEERQANYKGTVYECKVRRGARKIPAYEVDIIERILAADCGDRKYLFISRGPYSKPDYVDVYDKEGEKIDSKSHKKIDKKYRDLYSRLNDEIDRRKK